MPIVRNKIFSTNTAKYTIVDLKQEMNECISILLNLGYEVHIPAGISINGRLKRALGRCNRNRGVYNIEINETFLRTADSQSVHNTIMHECIHCVDGCFNHSPTWKKVCAKIMEKYPQYTINRMSYDEEYDQIFEKTSPYKYQIICPDCGCKMTRYKKWSKVLQSIYRKEGRYCCSKCGSKKIIVVNV